MKQVEIIVRSKRLAAEFLSDIPWAAISVSTDLNQWPVLSDVNRVDLLQLAFYDVSNPDFKMTGMLEEHIFDSTRAQQVLNFVDRVWENIDVLLVHCEAGISRSAAIAAAISHIKYGRGSDNFFFNSFVPNYLVYKTILQEYYGDQADPLPQKQSRSMIGLIASKYILV